MSLSGRFVHKSANSGRLLMKGSSKLWRACRSFWRFPSGDGTIPHYVQRIEAASAVGFMRRAQHLMSMVGMVAV